MRPLFRSNATISSGLQPATAIPLEAGAAGVAEVGSAAPVTRVASPRLLFVALAALLVALLGIAFRSYTLRFYSTLPADFDGPYIFRAQYLREYGWFLTERLKVYSYWSGGVNTELAFYLMEALQASVIQLSVWTGLAPRLIHQIALTGMLIGLSSFLLLRGSARNPLGLAGVALVGLLITLGTPVAIMYLNGWNSAYGWVLLLALTAIAVSDLSPSWRVGLSVAVYLLGPPLYHTFALLFTIYVVAIFVLGRLGSLRQIVISPAPVIVYYLSYQLYLSVQFFRELATGLYDVATLNFLTRDPLKITIAVAGAEEAYLRYVNLALWLLLSIPIGLVGLRYLRYLLGREPAGRYGQTELKYMAAVSSLAMTVVTIAVLVGLKFNLEFAINRGAEYMIVPALLAVVCELRYARRPFYVYPVVCAALALSLYSFWVQAPTVRASNFISQPEAEGYGWLAQRLRSDDVVFTEFRLSGPFIADGFLRVVGISGQQREDTRGLLRDIYYESTPATLTAGIDRIRTYHDDRPANYLFLSTQMMRNYPGLNGYGTHFQPAPVSFFAAVANSPEWEPVYRNEQVIIYRRR
jgi:hypothetical protein